jgi:peptidoglycan/LPS O-acetylase OafA/YrhL
MGTEAVQRARVAWLDGVRALAALYVVLHHAWLHTYGGYPGNDGPVYVGWLVHGHIAVAVFIVVSGFSLALGPARHGMSLPEGGTGFIRRRFWRIVPPYWAALALSVVFVVAGLSVTPTGDPIGARDVVVHALLIQDAVENVTPNGAMWSIAVEWQIYFFFPLLLICYRWLGPWRSTAAATGAVIVLHVLARPFPVLHFLDRFTPHFAILFAFGCLAVTVARRIPTVAAARAAVATWLTFAVVRAVVGPEFVAESYFWLELWLGAGVALAFAAMSTGGLRMLAHVLEHRVLGFLGHMAYSIYLVHSLFLDLIRIHLLAPLGVEGAQAFWPLLLLGVPASVLAAWCFFLVFERPFLTIRSARQLAQALSWRRTARPAAGGSRPGPAEIAG